MAKGAKALIASSRPWEGTLCLTGVYDKECTQTKKSYLFFSYHLTGPPERALLIQELLSNGLFDKDDSNDTDSPTHLSIPLQCLFCKTKTCSHIPQALSDDALFVA